MITIKHISGVGVNGYYGVYRDGTSVATIRRYGRSRFIIRSVHYGEDLAMCSNINHAREKALTIDYPDAAVAYEMVCQQVEKNRRQWKESALNSEILKAVYELAKGSNSAHNRLVELTVEIETFAKDRNATRKEWDKWWAAERAAGRECYVSSEPFYPNTPEEERKNAAA